MEILLFETPIAAQLLSGHTLFKEEQSRFYKQCVAKATFVLRAMAWALRCCYAVRSHCFPWRLSRKYQLCHLFFAATMPCDELGLSCRMVPCSALEL